MAMTSSPAGKVPRGTMDTSSEALRLRGRYLPKVGRKAGLIGMDMRKVVMKKGQMVTDLRRRQGGWIGSYPTGVKPTLPTTPSM